MSDPFLIYAIVLEWLKESTAIISNFKVPHSFALSVIIFFIVSAIYPFSRRYVIPLCIALSFIFILLGIYATPAVLLIIALHNFLIQKIKR